jgi:hypothetical protein
METLDLSKLEVPTTLKDQEFDQRFVGDAISYLKNIRDNSRDYVVNTEAMTIVPSATTDNEWTLWLESKEEGLKVLAPTEWAKQQTIGATRLPKKYHDELIETGHIDEAMNHLNMWLSESKEKKFQVRTVGNNYRALVSPGYNSFDNYSAFQTIANALNGINSMRTEADKPAKFYKAQISDRSMYVHIIDEGREWDIGKGDTYKPMIVIKNSEVGNGAFSAEAGLWRYICGNLLLHGVIKRKIHHGEKLEEGIYSPETRKKQEELWMGITRDIVNAGIASDELYQNIINELMESKEVKIDDPIQSVKEIKKEYKLTDDEESEIIKMMLGDTTVEQEDKNTLFQIVQGMTQASQQMGIERGIEVNRIAGNIPALIKVVA